MVVIVLIYAIYMYITYTSLSKPVKKIERAVEILRTGKAKKPFELGKAKQFVEIEKDLNEINENYKNQEKLLKNLVEREENKKEEKVLNNEIKKEENKIKKENKINDKSNEKTEEKNEEKINKKINKKALKNKRKISKPA